MTLTRRQALALLAATPVVASSHAAFASSGDGSVINVELWDKGTEAIDAFDMTDPIMLGTPGAARQGAAPMGMRVDVDHVKAGEVMFKVTNTSAELEHEMIVVPVADTSQPLPYDPETQRFDEDAAGALGEVEETEPGDKGSLTLRLKAGTYLLACNIPGHYPMGMWTLITVG